MNLRLKGGPRSRRANPLPRARSGKDLSSRPRRIRLNLPDEEWDAVVVICTELPNNPGTFITNAVRRIAAEVIEVHLLSTPPVWIEHHPPETTNGYTESFEMVLFDSYEVRESRAPYMGDRAVEIGSPTWKALDRASVEMLVGEELR